MFSFAQYITENKNHVTFTFGRFNPPTNGHEKLLDKVASIAGSGKYLVFASHSNDAKKNPLSYEQKIKWMRKMFPKHARAIAQSKDKTVMHILSSLYKEGHDSVTMVVGSDRVNEFEILTNKYNGAEGRHGFYNFKDGIKVVSAGERDPDAEGVSGMSASKMRTAAVNNDFISFSKGLPKGFKDGQALFNELRLGMGLSESYSYREHVQLETVSETREQYVAGELFDVGDTVVIKESEEIATITQLGANYVIVECNGKALRKWVDSVEPLNETKLSKSTMDKRQAHFNKNKDKADDDDSAYKPAPGDARAKTKPSKHTKKFHKMFGEDTLEESSKTALKNKAEKTGLPLGILTKVYNRGVAAWKSSHKPGTTPEQWGMARVNSFATKGKGTWGGADKDLAAKV